MTSSGSNARLDPVLAAAIQREFIKANQGSSIDVNALSDAVYGGLAAKLRMRNLESQRDANFSGMDSMNI